MRRLNLILLLGLLLLSNVTAIQTLGTFPKDSQINLVQGCDNSTYSNVTKISYPGTSSNKSFAINEEIVMSSTVSNNYNYTFTLTSEIGQYIIYGHCDEDGINTAWVYDIWITSTGDRVNLSNAILPIVFLVFALILFALGWSFSGEHWILKTFFNFCSVGMGILAINSAKIVASESASLGRMGTTGLTLVITIFLIFFIYIFVYAFIEIIKALKEKRGVRWNYD